METGKKKKYGWMEAWRSVNWNVSEENSHEHCSILMLKGLEVDEAVEKKKTF